LILGIAPTFLGIVVGVVFGVLPDFDVLIMLFSAMRGGKFKMDGLDFKHHEFPSHFPLIYSPLIVIVIIFPNIYTFTMISALYLHLFVDSFYTSDGIKWLYPFKDKYYSLQSEKIKGKHGILWAFEYKKTPLYKLEFVFLAIACLILWLNHIFYYRLLSWQLGLVGGLIICFLIGYFFLERARTRHFEKSMAEREENYEIQSF
jgi:hypothetical protein